METTINSTNHESSDVTTAGTTVFTDPVNVVTNHFVKPQEKSDLYSVTDQSIVDFLKKPSLIGYYLWNTTQTQMTEIAQSTPRTNLLSNPLWKDKIKGFNFIRATAVYRVVINATPFHAGLLKFAFVPFCGTAVTAPNVQQDWRQQYIGSISTLPGCMIDARDSTAIISIPYVSPSDYTTIETSDSPDWGKWYLTVLSPLNTGASSQNNVSVSVYLHFEDVELAAPIHPQSSAGGKNFKAKVVSRVGKAINDTEAEVMSNGGSVSKGLMQAGKIAADMSSIPMLSSLAAPTSWMLRGAGAVASWFGYSKPDIVSSVTHVSRLNQPNMSNATGLDSAPTLALYHDNAIAVKPGFGADDVDEMSFDYIKRIPAIINTSTWGTDYLPGDEIATFDVSPTRCRKQEYYDGVTDSFYYDFMAPFAYLVSFFQLYRGSIDYHFRIVKTDYHSGKLSFHFVPASGLTTPTTANQQYLLREIVDIRDKSEITLRIPYLQFQKYVGVNDSLGKLYVTVVNELRAPESCAQEIKILVSVSAGEDFEYAVPGDHVEMFTNGQQLPIIPQMGASEMDTDQSIVSKPIGNYPMMHATNDPSSMAIGEKFTSLRQLLLRYSRLAFNTTNQNFGATEAWSYWPFDTAISRLRIGDQVVVSPALSYDHLSRLAHGFAFMRGSIRLLTKPHAANAQCAMVNNTRISETVAAVFESNIVYEDNVGSTFNNRLFMNGASIASQQYDQGIGAVSARFPYYCETHSTPVLLQTNSNAIPKDVWDPYSTALFKDYGSNGSPVNIYRSVGEDFQLGYFLGFPPLFWRVTR